jgi:dCMP deaminase
VHAEINAICYAQEHDLARCVMYVTTSPCLKCAQEIAEWKIPKIFFRQKYREEEGFDYLNHNHVEIYRVLPNGMILDQRGEEMDGD